MSNTQQFPQIMRPFKNIAFNLESRLPTTISICGFANYATMFLFSNEGPKSEPSLVLRVCVVFEKAKGIFLILQSSNYYRF